MKNKIIIFTIRWLSNSIGIWVAVRLLGDGFDGLSLSMSLMGFIFAGLVFSIINSVLKPILVIFALPFILLSLGLFMFIVNGLLVYISLNLAPGISMSFPSSILAGMILSLVNYIVSAIVIVTTKELS